MALAYIPPWKTLSNICTELDTELAEILTNTENCPQGLRQRPGPRTVQFLFDAGQAHCAGSVGGPIQTYNRQAKKSPATRGTSSQGGDSAFVLFCLSYPAALCDAASLAAALSASGCAALGGGAVGWLRSGGCFPGSRFAGSSGVARCGEDGVLHLACPPAASARAAADDAVLSGLVSLSVRPGQIPAAALAAEQIVHILGGRFEAAFRMLSSALLGGGYNPP